MTRLFLFLMLTTLSSFSWGGEQVAPAAPPPWLLNPDKPGYLSVVGFSPKQDWGGRDAQYRVALMKARQELAQIIRVHITSSAQSNVEDRNGKITRENDFEIRLQSSVDLELNSARVIEEWTDPKNGSLYIWLTTPISQP